MLQNNAREEKKTLNIICEQKFEKKKALKQRR